MQSDKTTGITTGVTFFDISVVKCPEMQSQWQAGFMGIFPVNCLSLPATHPSDKEFFEKHWKGDNYTTYEQFTEKYK
jgi:hypothetical protein